MFDPETLNEKNLGFIVWILLNKLQTIIYKIRLRRKKMNNMVRIAQALRKIAASLDESDSYNLLGMLLALLSKCKEKTNGEAKAAIEAAYGIIQKATKDENGEMLTSLDGGDVSSENIGEILSGIKEYLQ